MGERDAFGREKGEDTLAELGWRTTAPAESHSYTPEPLTSPPEPQFEAAEESPFEPDEEPQFAPPPPLRRRRRRPVLRLLFFVAFAGLLIWGIQPLVEFGRETADKLDQAVREAVPTVVETPAATDAESLFRPAALRQALAQLPEGDIETLRVAPERIDAQVVSEGRMHVVQVTADGRVRNIETPATGTGDSVRIDPDAPQRIVRTAARRADRDPDTVSYLVLLNLAGKSEWQLFFDDGLHFSASASGKKVRRVG
jgi:hypothetical protein